MTDRKTETRTAGAFDLRYILALLFIIYGVVVTIMGTAVSQADLAKAGGWNLNLWTGIAMIIVAVLFAAWAKWRPIKIEVPADDDLPAGASGED
ncbi:MAG: hypothetical protein ACRDRN_21940 [Sciscionella sp.]